MQLGTPLRVNHLPIVMDILRRSKVLEVINHAVVDDRRSKVSTSECVAVILCSVFSGAHDLWRVRARLERYDMRTVMQDAGFDIQEFPEERLAKALDDLWSVDVNKLMTSLAIQVIDGFQLDTGFCHFDTTSLSFYGGYEREEFGSMTEDMPPAPQVTYGYSKNHRGDLKQIMCGTMLSADGGIPLVARGVDGNRSDNEVAAEFFTDLRKVVADPREVCCVADSKGWCARTVGVVHDHGMRLLSRLPRGTRLHRGLVAADWEPTGRIETPGKRLKDAPIVVTYQGFDKTETFTRIVDDASTAAGPAAGKATGKTTATQVPAKTETFTIPVRVVKIRASDLLRTKMATARRMGSRERVKAEK